MERPIFMNKIAKLLIGSGEKDGNIRYASGFAAPDPFLCFLVDDRRYAVLSPLEYARAAQYAAPNVELIAENELEGRTVPEKILSIAKKYAIDSFVVPADFPLLTADAMRDAGLIVRAQENPFFAAREFKSREEVEKIRSSQRAAEAGLDAALTLLKATTADSDGHLLFQGDILTSERLRYEIDSTMLRLGMIPQNTICAGGIQGSQPHNPGSGPLKANAPIVMDIFPQSAVHGYWGDLTRTVVRGEPSDLVQNAWNAVKTARDEAKKRIQIGAIPAEIHQYAAAIMEKAGFHTGNSDGVDFGFFHGLGHGVGLDIHEAPRIAPRNQLPLKGGEVFTIEPGLYYREWGGIRLEDLMYLAPDGTVECLTAAPTEMLVL